MSDAIITAVKELHLQPTLPTHCCQTDVLLSIVQQVAPQRTCMLVLFSAWQKHAC
jgi:hypothetical protein